MSQSHFFHSKACLALLTVLAWTACFKPAAAISVNFNGGQLIINDQGTGDTNPAINVVDFNQLLGNYQVSGTIDLGSGPNLSQLISIPQGSLRLTNFVAEAVGSPSGPFSMDFSHTVVGTYTGIQAADALDAYASHATGAPIPAGTDFILDWQGYVSGALIQNLVPGPPPYFNPNVPPASAPLPYTVVSHGPTPFGNMTNPVVGAIFTFHLGNNGDQIQLFTSGEVGFSQVPEPGSLALAGVGLVALGIIARRRKR